MGTTIDGLECRTVRDSNFACPCPEFRPMMSRISPGGGCLTNRPKWMLEDMWIEGDGQGGSSG